MLISLSHFTYAFSSDTHITNTCFPKQLINRIDGKCVWCEARTDYFISFCRENCLKILY